MKKMGKSISLALIVLMVITLLPINGDTFVQAKKKVNASSVTITKPTSKSLTMLVGKTYQLKVRVKPTNATNKQVSYKSSNSKIVSVSSSGKLVAKKKGSVKITVTAKDGSGKKAYLSVKAVTPVSKITITKPSVNSIVITKGKTYTLKTSVSPSNAYNKGLIYSSSNTKIATVSSKGKITGKKNGTAIITVKAKDGSGKKAAITVIVGYRITKIVVTPNTITKPVGTTYQINAKISPSNASKVALKYSSSNTSLATVDSKGKVLLKKPGKVKITVASLDTSAIRTTVTINITQPVQSIRLAQTSVTKEVGSSYQIVATILPSDATNKKLAYSSSNTALATVDANGKVLLKKAGTVIITATATDGSNKSASCTFTIVNKAEPPKPDDGYKLVWNDEFNGDKLNRADWNYELHQPGWVNNELQEYIDSEENIFVKDGSLVIKAIKKDDENGTTYTSGRVNTQGKHDFKYGRFEARVKVPSGQGFLPAFWMMPTDENVYGQWPKCGEIDIMEVLGSQTNKAYGTLHFGEPHTHKQGSYELANGDFASEYHVFSCEWEPDEIRYYIDGKLYYTVNDWFTKKPGFGEVTYPAPFDQPFYMILNLAVGGNWPGNPDSTTQFGENAELTVDYVRVYQKDSYDENVQKPITQVVLRDPDATGNYINNGNFSVNESLSDNKDWGFLLAGSGNATAEISNNSLLINTVNAGDLDYSVQVVQPDLPMENGYRYRLTFDALATEDRTMITDISAPDNGYKRYMPDTKTQLTTTKQSYSYEFDMLNASDANGRLEFNLGNQGSTASVTISNVRLEKIGQADIPVEVKSVLPDGNYVYNGEFQEGANRLAYWNITNLCNGAIVSVTNMNNKRELKASVPTTVVGIDQIVVKQDSIAISGDKTYILSFDAYGDNNQTMQTSIAGQLFTTTLTNAKTTYKYTFTTEAGLDASTLNFLLGVAGTVYIDNVRIQEDSLFINGDFTNGLTGYEVFTDSSVASQVYYGVDSLNEDNAAFFDISYTGNQDWKIQLKQNNIKLENGKWYKISLNAKSSIDRKIMYALQRDGSADNDWTPYSGSKLIDLTKDYQTFSTVFQMTSTTDPRTIFSVSMGSVGGIEINSKHQICIDNIKLEEVDAPTYNGIEIGTDLIKNGDFSQTEANWISAITAPGAANVEFAQGKVTFDVTNPGTADWNVQLKQGGLFLENGSTYKVKFTIKSSEARTVKFALLTATYAWYGGADITLKANEEYTVEQDVTVSNASDSAIDFVLSMGKIANEDTKASTIEIRDISIVKIQ